MGKLIMALALMPLMALADTEKVGDVTWTYKVVSEEVTIKGVEPCTGKLEIPQTLGGHPVSIIGVAAFSDCENLVELVIPEGVVDIGAAAFCDCIGLKAVTIPSTLVNIGDAAFEGCDALTTVDVASGDIESVKAMIVESDSGIDVDSLTFIGPLADGGPYKETVDGVEWTFRISEGKAILENEGESVIPVATTGALVVPVTLGGRPVMCIGAYAFKGCSGLTSVVIPEGVLTVGECAFASCLGLTSVTIPESVMLIGLSVFLDCPNVVSLTLPYCALGELNFFEKGGVTADELPLLEGLRLVEELFTKQDPFFGDNACSVPGCDYSWHLGMLFGSRTMEEDMEKYYSANYCYEHHFDPTYCEEVIGIMWGGCINYEGSLLPRALRSVVITRGDAIMAGSFSDCRCLTSITLPPSITGIGMAAFLNCDGLVSIAMSKDVIRIGERAFSGCSGLTDVILPARLGKFKMSTLFPDAKGIESVTWLDDGSKTSVIANSCSGLEELERVVIPANVMNVEDQAFYNCHKLKSVVFEGSAPDVGTEVFNGTPKDLVISVPSNSVGWDGGFTSTALPSTWGGRAIAHVGESYDWSKGTTAPAVAVAGGSVTVSNVVVHYILNSVQPEFSIQPADDMNFVNIITEVKGSAAVAIPKTWADNYPGFAEKFGADFTQALLKPSGKIGTGGTPMLVWQDYVAGTDPTDEKDVFTASITIVDGKVTISYTPELDEARKAMRKYTIWGKTSLLDTEWTEVQDGHESEYNFFKVSVEMK